MLFPRLRGKGIPAFSFPLFFLRSGSVSSGERVSVHGIFPVRESAGNAFSGNGIERLSQPGAAETLLFNRLRVSAFFSGVRTAAVLCCGAGIFHILSRRGGEPGASSPAEESLDEGMTAGCGNGRKAFLLSSFLLLFKEHPDPGAIVMTAVTAERFRKPDRI